MICEKCGSFLFRPHGGEPEPCDCREFVFTELHAFEER